MLEETIVLTEVLAEAMADEVFTASVLAEALAEVLAETMADDGFTESVLTEALAEVLGA